MRFKEYLGEAKLKGYVDPFKTFSDLESNVFYTLFVDEPESVYDSDGFHDEMIDVAKLVPTQSEVDGKVDSDDPLTVVHRKGTYYVIDGHHRLYTAMKNNKKQVLCSVLDLPDEPVNDLEWFIEKLGKSLKMSKNGIVRLG